MEKSPSAVSSVSSMSGLMTPSSAVVSAAAAHHSSALVPSSGGQTGGGSSSGLDGQTTPPWQGRAIATHKLRLMEFSAYVDQQRDQESFNKHLFVHIGGPVSYADPILEVRGRFFKKKFSFFVTK